MSEYIVELPMSGAAEEFIAKHGVDDCLLYGYKLTGEIVRCRNCACWFKGYCGRHSYEVANEYGDMYTEGLFPMDEDDFCSLGERMEK